MLFFDDLLGMGRREPGLGSRGLQWYPNPEGPCRLCLASGHVHLQQVTISISRCITSHNRY